MEGEQTEDGLSGRVGAVLLTLKTKPESCWFKTRSRQQRSTRDEMRGRTLKVSHLREDDEEDIIVLREAERLGQPSPGFLLVGGLNQAVLDAVFGAA